MANKCFNGSRKVDSCTVSSGTSDLVTFWMRRKCWLNFGVVVATWRSVVGALGRQCGSVGVKGWRAVVASEHMPAIIASAATAGAWPPLADQRPRATLTSAGFYPQTLTIGAIITEGDSLLDPVIMWYGACIFFFSSRTNITIPVTTSCAPHPVATTHCHFYVITVYATISLHILRLPCDKASR